MFITAVLSKPSDSAEVFHDYVNAGARNGGSHATLFVTGISMLFVSKIPNRARALSPPPLDTSII